MIKDKLKRLFQNILGFDNYLFIFSILTIKRIYMGKHEEEFVHFLSLLPTDKLVLDIGANIGIMTVPLAQRAGHGKVYSFEPMPENLKVLKRVIKYFKLKNITLFEFALGNEPGKLKMLMPVIDHVKMQGLSHVMEKGSLAKGEQYIVPVKKLDDIPELKKAEAIGGIKIDVENFEYEVLQGAKNLLLKHKPIIYCELWNDEKRTATLNYLKNEIGYTIKIYDGKKLVPYANQDMLNFFMVP